MEIIDELGAIVTSAPRRKGGMKKADMTEEERKTLEAFKRQPKKFTGNPRESKSNK